MADTFLVDDAAHKELGIITNAKFGYYSDIGQVALRLTVTMLDYSVSIIITDIEVICNELKEYEVQDIFSLIKLPCVMLVENHTAKFLSLHNLAKP